MNTRADRFGAIYAQLEWELDWELLGRSYCDGDGSAFFDSRRRARILDTGLRLADDLAARLRARGPRQSLYVGAATAELAPILVEHLLLERKLVWLNVDSPEIRELARALGIVAARNAIELPLPVAKLALGPGSCDHIWIVSVLTDPEHFPALHDDLYERVGGELAAGGGSLSEDLRRARELARTWLACAAAPCTLSTTDEELTLLAPLAAERGLRLEIPAQGRLSALVGDRVRLCSLT